MSEEEVVAVPYQRSKDERLIDTGEGIYVLISHRQVDYLIGSLMGMCDVMGDKEQRDAVKSEIKQRVRSWLDDRYAVAGYSGFRVNPDVETIKI